MRIGQHLLAGLLLVVGVARAIMMGDGVATVIVAALAFTAAYWYPVLARRPGQLTTPVWLGIVTVVWIGALLARSEERRGGEGCSTGGQSKTAKTSQHY